MLGGIYAIKSSASSQRRQSIPASIKDTSIDS
jgi:hypothetical protein